MRKGFFFLAPFVLVAGLHMACSSAEVRRSGFDATEPEDAGAEGGDRGPAFAEIDAGKNDGGEGCSSSQTDVSRIPVVIEFVVDDSGSMDGAGANNKWAAARDALLAAFDDMKTLGDPATFVGVLRFGSAIRFQVAPGTLADQSHYQQLYNSINTPNAGGGGTATLLAMTEGYRVVQQFTPPPGSGLAGGEMNRAVVLMSDGVPNGQAAEQTQVQNLAAQKFGLTPPDGPILTFSVGIGPFPSTSTGSYDPAFMSRVAIQGGTAPQDCSPTSPVPEGLCHFQVTPGGDIQQTKQALIDAINKIRAATASCEFGFTTNDNTDLTKVEVKIKNGDGTETIIPKDPENGWSFDDEENPSKIILNGESCSATGGTVSGAVDVTLGCKTAN